MSVKKWLGVTVGAAIIAALGLELWTFSEMVWRGFFEQNRAEQSPTTDREQPSDNFKFGRVEGKFKILYLRATRPDWSFHGVIEFSNPSDQRIHLTISGVRLQSGDQVSITESIILEPGGNKTVQIQADVPVAQSPGALKIHRPDSPDQSSQWFELPKVPVRRE